MKTESIREVLESYGYHITADTGEFYRTRANYRNGDNNNVLSINKATGWFTDFKTGETGPLEKLIKLTTGEIVSYNLEARPIATNFLEQIKQDIAPPMDTSSVYPLLPAFTFYKKRGISEKTLKHFESGLCTHGPLNDRFVFPIKDENGEIVGWAGRDMLNKPNRPKWKLMGKKKQWIYPYFYNSNILSQSKQVILIEGISDMVALHEAGIGQSLVIFGLDLSNKILSSLLTLSPDRIILALNDDKKEENYGQDACNKIKVKLMEWFSPEKIQIIPPTQNDFGDMSKEEIHTWAATNKIYVEK